MVLIGLCAVLKIYFTKSSIDFIMQNKILIFRNASINWGSVKREFKKYRTKGKPYRKSISVPSREENKLQM